MKLVSKAVHGKFYPVDNSHTAESNMGSPTSHIISFIRKKDIVS